MKRKAKKPSGQGLHRKGEQLPLKLSTAPAGQLKTVKTAKLPEPKPLVVLPDRKAFLDTDAKIRSEAIDLKVAASRLAAAIKTPDDEKQASALLLKLSGLEKEANANADLILKPIKEVIHLIESARNESLSTVHEAIKALKLAIAEYIQRERAKRLVAAQKKADNRGKKNIEDLRAAALALIDEGKYEEAANLRKGIGLESSDVVEVEEVEVSDGIQQRHVWDYDQTQVNMMLLPEKYKKVVTTIKRQLILSDLAKSKGKLKIPGLKISWMLSVAVTKPGAEEE